jgi:hypothetical protein
MRQMPASQWVAFEDDAAHNCAAAPKASPERKPGQRHASPWPAPLVDHEFGEFELPNDQPVTAKKPAIVGFDTTRASTPQPPVQRPGPGLEPRSGLPVGGPIAGGSLHLTPSQPAALRAEPVHPAPATPGQEFRKWLLGFLAFALLLGLVKVALRESTRPNLLGKADASSIQSDDQTNSSPSIKILRTRPNGPDQNASAPSTPNTPGPAAGPYPPWLNKVTLPAPNQP